MPALLNSSSKDSASVVSSWVSTASIKKAVSDADAIIITTEWDEFCDVDWRDLGAYMRKPAWLFDTRGVTKEADLTLSGIQCWRLGTSVDFQ